MVEREFIRREFTGLEERASASAALLVRDLSGLGRTLVLAESCTAGLAADILARVPGASRVLWGSFVCYTAQAKAAMLGLDPGRLSQYGLVSAETASNMALGALEKSGAFFAASVTGLAGPDGDGSAVPVGTVWIGLARRGEGVVQTKEFHLQGKRNEVRLQAAAAVFEELLRLTKQD